MAKGRTDSNAIHDRKSLRATLERIKTLLVPACRLAGVSISTNTTVDGVPIVGDLEASGIENLTIDYQKSVECALRDLGRWTDAGCRAGLPGKGPGDGIRATRRPRRGLDGWHRNERGGKRRRWRPHSGGPCKGTDLLDASR
jgi:hypothetical protein